MNLDGNQINFQIDTGASVTVLSGQDFKRYFRGVSLKDDRAVLRAYSGHTIPTLGTFRPNVCYNSVVRCLSCTVVDNNGPNLMGRDWLRAFDFHPEKMLNNVETVETMLQRYPAVFSEDYGDVKVSCKIEVRPDAVPKFYRPRPVPYAMRSKVEAELSRLVTEGILLQKQSSDWAAPIVPVEKADGSIRLCGDYKTTVNSVLTPDHYPLPLIDDLYSKLAHFTKLDLRCAYLQIPVEEESRKYTTINTHRGLFEFARLPFGVASAVGIFQRIVDDLFRDMPQVCAYLDDILITGKTLSDHLVNLEEVLRRLDEAGLRLNRKKCVFLAPEVEYLGHRIDNKGLHPTKRKLDAIMQAPVPTDASQLKAYLGLLNYYGRFLRNLSSELAPLYELLQKQKEFQWTKRHQMAFEKSKKMIESSSLLVFYDPNKPLILTTDASSYGVGAVLSHTIDGLERPIYCASRTLSQAEKNYSQIEKESLSVVFGVKRFHQFLYGRKFEIHNDHRPLEGLLGEQKGIPTMASGRIRRWALTLSAYTYTFRYKSGKSIPCADALSRLPLPASNTDKTCVPMENIHSFEYLNIADPLNAHKIQAATRNDKVLSRVHCYVQTGIWPENIPDDFKAWHNRKDELSCEQGCVLWGSRVAIPTNLRPQALQMLHDGHPGIVKMKAVARSNIFWPNIDRDIESMVNSCSPCQQSRAKPPKSPLQHWPTPERPWSTLHADYLGPLHDGKMVLVIIDAYSKYIDAFVCNSSTADSTISKFMTSFATHGLCDTLVTDNGPCFAASEFEQFVSNLGIKHIKIAPYHPSSNGLAEKAVHIIKDAIGKIPQGTLERKLTRFLFKYRNTPHTTTNETPAFLLFGRKPITPLDRVRPSVQNRVAKIQARQKSAHDRSVQIRAFNPGDAVFAQNYSRGSPWLSGVVEHELSPVTYRIKLQPTGLTVKRHVDQLRKRHERLESPEGCAVLSGQSNIGETSLDVLLPSSDGPGISELEPIRAVPEPRPTLPTTESEHVDDGGRAAVSPAVPEPRPIQPSEPEQSSTGTSTTSTLRRSARLRKPREIMDL